MSGIETSPQTTLVILLGASEWPDADLKGSPAFKHSANKVKDYFSQPYLFGLPTENFLDLFDQRQSPFDVDVAISEFLENRIKRMKDLGTPAKDLLFYYIGHGMFAEGQNQAYHLAIRSTRKGSMKTSAILVEALSDTLKSKARHLRRLVILDCCFSGVAAKYMQSDTPGQGAIQQTITAFKEYGQGSGFPQKGTSILCSSSKDHFSFLLPNESGTMFSEALVRALTEGNKSQREKPHLSLYDLRAAIEEMLGRLAEEQNMTAPHPEVHSPGQSEGDVAFVPFFPNPHAKEERRIAVEAEQEATSGSANKASTSVSKYTHTKDRLLEPYEAHLISSSDAAGKDDRNQWWAVDDRISHLKRAIKNETVLTLLNLTASHPTKWISFEQVYREAGRSVNQARADLNGLTRLIKQLFPNNAGGRWPVNFKGGSSLQYQMSEEIALQWKRS